MNNRNKKQMDDAFTMKLSLAYLNFQMLAFLPNALRLWVLLLLCKIRLYAYSENYIHMTFNG